RLVGVFVASSVIPLFIPILFSQPIIGASAGVYGMIGYLLPDMVGVIPLPFSYALMLPVILLESCFTCNPWGKLFHIFGLTIGVVLHYMFDMHSLNLRKTAIQLSMGTDYYALRGLGYQVEYNLPTIKIKDKK
ncbi:MAG: hypothetical protein GOV01_01175, partial [Candidatus Altiarchaeota archaeon]|nr:hypothetical protein [Candidatus Altiarchaeota archaeon]